MKALIAMVALVVATGGAFAAETKKEPSAAQKAQQEKMKSCNAEAKVKDLKGDERKQFMSGCLKAAPTTMAAPEEVKAAPAKTAAPDQAMAAPTKQTQQDKMKACNAEAGSKALKGDERKKFMSECLKG
ncbi:MAG: phosphate-starvation-inducible protein PsiF [Candidatus Accumulibacter sp.]|mgnify:CR=1 FL=1|uniref:PsiF family protein n=1 Tax=Accumulibacter sp. TaxID=2053492 RepID=UPI0019FAAD5B|nr:PsiF family protein [Accumulibacter sp.]MBE2259864.1 phosphate-starvation-inducible protein PsiF [Paracoccaceae bacterium]MCB1942620.1 phosphate-starvation-inducible protein PsiF [Accumulibacter sp.]MCP5248860.1 phosphate-starvation-inducible protein PsiF [Accumulibacter sp.]